MPPKRRLQIGFILPAVQSSLASLVERHGFDSVWAGEHIIGYQPEGEATTMVAAAAAVTKRITVGTSVLLLALRHPVVAAKTLATLDHIAGGRLIAGVGVGGEFGQEYQACGVPLRERGSRTDEAIVILRKLWSGEPVSHKSVRFPLDNVRLDLTPKQPGGPPIWIGGRSEAALHRAATLGDGVIPYMYSPEQFRAAVTRIKEIAEKNGREPAGFTFALCSHTAAGKDRAKAEAEAAQPLSGRYNQKPGPWVRRYGVLGTTADWLERIEEYVAAGVQHLVLDYAGRPSGFEEMLEGYAELLPRLRRLAVR